MKRSSLALFLIFVSYYCFAQQTDWSEVEQAMGKKGNIQENVFRITFPRSDLDVKVDDFTIAPGLVLTSWIGFIKSNSQGMSMNSKIMMMGDLVLLENEVPTVISGLVEKNLQVTAVHNHILGEEPSIKYVHFSGTGDAIKLATAIKYVISRTGTPINAKQQGQQPLPDWAKVEAVLGTTGKKNGNLLQYSFPRKEKLKDSGMEMPPAMGMATAINFQMDGSKCAITGDFVLLADEVNPVVKALTENGIVVTALHNHMLYDEPRLFMMHFWAVDDPGKLAEGLKAALQKTNIHQ